MSRDLARPRGPFLAGIGIASIAGSLLFASCGTTATTAIQAGVTSTVAATPLSTPLSTPTSTAPDKASSTTIAPADLPKKVAITATDYKYEGFPPAMAVGAELTLTNQSPKELHEMVVFRLPDTEKRSAQDLAALPQAELQKLFAGPPTTVIVAPPGQPGFPVVGDGTIGKPGRYFALCSIPTGADPAAYMAAAAKAKGGPVSVPGGPPHLMAGMYAEFTVQ